jgi:hypothetical protein
LLLVRKPFAKEIPVPRDLEGVAGFDGKELADAFANRVSPWEVVEISAGIPRLLLDPSPGLERIGVFKPAVWVRHGDAMNYLRNGFGRRKRERRH